MLMGFIGRMGQGKTLSMTAFGLWVAKTTGAGIFSRHSVVGATKIKSIKDIWEVDNAVLLYDEMWIDMDSRDWKNNIDLTRWIQQSRKKSILIGYTVQHYSQIEKRVRKATDVLVFCEKLYRKQPIKGSEQIEKIPMVKLTFVDGQSGQIYKVRLIRDIRPFYQFYDTYEAIQPLEKPAQDYDEPKKWPYKKNYG